LIEEEEIVLWNGLKAKLCSLESAPAIAKACKKVKRGGRKPTQVLRRELHDYWLTEIHVDNATVYLVTTDANWLNRKTMKCWLMTAREEIYHRVLFVVYAGTAHFWAENSGQIILTAIDQKTSPGIAAITSVDSKGNAGGMTQ
jgi:hypothetical protein